MPAEEQGWVHRDNAVCRLEGEHRMLVPMEGVHRSFDVRVGERRIGFEGEGERRTDSEGERRIVRQEGHHTGYAPVHHIAVEVVLHTGFGHSRLQEEEPVHPTAAAGAERHNRSSVVLRTLAEEVVLHIG